MTDRFNKISKTCIGCRCMSSLFRLLNQEELEIVDANKLYVQFKAGETIRKQGTFMTHVLSVNQGYAKIYIEGIEGESAILRIVKPTSFIGGPGIYYDQLHHYSITALVDTSVCFIDMAIFKEILSRNHMFAEEFLRDFSHDVLTIYNRLIFLTQKQMPGRMADAVLYLYDEIFQQPRFPMILSRFELAGLSAMSRESAVKTLRDFQKEDLLRITEHEMEIVDVEGLRKISRLG
jgi:CRP/FNR family transcriptional regulator, polysaccharide utilization system transcription regulator